MSAPLCSCDVYDYNGSKRTCSQAAELTAKLEAAESEAVKYKLATKMNAACIRDQAAQIESLEKDAARYRLFRSKMNDVEFLRDLEIPVTADELDAARKESQP